MPLSKPIVVIAYSLIAMLIAAGFVAHRQAARRATAFERQQAQVAAKPIAELRMDGVTFKESVDRLQAAAGVPISIDTSALQVSGVDVDRPMQQLLFDLPLAKALDIVLDQAGGQTKLAWSFDGHGILISTAYELAQQSAIMVVYDVRDIDVRSWYNPERDMPTLCFGGTAGPNNGGGGGGRGGGGGGGLFGGPQVVTPAKTDDELRTDALDMLISTTVAPESWRESGGTLGAIQFIDGRMVVTQTPENQRLLARLLETLRHETGDEWPEPLK